MTLIYYASVSVEGLTTDGGRDRGHHRPVGRCLRLAAHATSRGACRLFAAGYLAVFDRGGDLVAWPLGGRDLGGSRHIRFGNLVLHSPQAFSRCCRRGARVKGFTRSAAGTTLRASLRSCQSEAGLASRPLRDLSGVGCCHKRREVVLVNKFNHVFIEKVCSSPTNASGRGNAQRRGSDMRFGVFCDDHRNR